MSWGNFDFAVNFNGVSGNKVYDNTANANFYKLRLSKAVNTTKEAIQFPEESINNAAPISTRFLKDGAFFRLNNAALGYTFDTKKMGADKWLQSLRLNVTGQNLFLITKYNGYDPDVNTDRAINGISSYGIDYLSYPKARTVIFGVNFGF
jgi:iron complex outermembrane receptor protein